MPVTPRLLPTLLLGPMLSLWAATAGAADVPLALLSLDTVDVPAAAGRVATEMLRRKLAQAPGLRLIPGRDLVEVKLVYGCMDERPACLAQAGKSLGAERLVYGSVRRPSAGGGYTVVLKQLHVPTARIEKFISDTVPVRIFYNDSSELEQLMDRWLGVLVTGALSGGLKVVSDPPGAEVTIDGKPVGRTPLERKELPAGDHVLTAAAPGHEQIVRTFRVQGGLVHEMTLQLRRRAAPAPAAALVEKAPPGAPRPRDGGRPFRAASYFLIGAAAIAGGVSIYTWRTYVGEQDPAREALDVLQMKIPASPEVSAFFSSSERLSSCEPPAELTIRAMADPVTSSAYRSYLDHCRRGRSYADATTGLLATMGSLALLGVTSYILGRTVMPGRERAGPDDAYRDKRASWLYKPRLTEISPAWGTSSGALNLRFEF